MKRPNSLFRTLTLAAGATLLTVSAYAVPPSWCPGNEPAHPGPPFWIVPGIELARARLDGVRAKLGAENGNAIGFDKSATNAAVRGFGNAKATWCLQKNAAIFDIEAQVDDSVDLGHNFRKSTLKFKGGQNSFANNKISVSVRAKSVREEMSGFRGGNNSMLTHGPIIGQVFRLEQTHYYEIAADGRKRVDPFVLEIDYDQDEFETTTGLTELQELNAGCLYLGWLNIGADGDGSTVSLNDKWVNAIQGNFANWEVFANLGVNRTDPLSLKEAGIVGLNMSYEDYYAGTTTVLGANTKAANSFWVGDYGADLENNTMWAVIDHHSDFATVPAGIPLPPVSPVLILDSYFESNSGQTSAVDATPTAGYPTDYTYQWSFKAVSSNSYFIIPSSFGGTASSYQILGDAGNNGTWKVEVTNDTGTSTAEFNYRVYADSDSDGLSDGREEFVLGTDPNNNDSDGDALLDGVETNTGIWVSTSDTGTDPLSNDTDADGLLDGVETNTGEYVDASDTGTDPINSDTDSDGLLDGTETNTGIYVSSSDTGTNPLLEDSDFDSIPDGYETATGVWIDGSDTGTDPNNADSDSDGLSDKVETNSGIYGGLTDTGTDPNDSDSDGDGFSDQYEVNTSYDPTGSEDTPDAVLTIKTAIELEFHGANGGTYRIEYTEDLESNVWTVVEEGILGESALVERLHSIDDFSYRFFRVVRTDQ